MSRYRTVLITGDVDGATLPNIPFRTSVVVDWADAATSLAAVDVSDLGLAIVVDSNEARGKQRIEELAALLPAHTRRALVSRGSTPFAPSPGIETGTAEVLAGVSASPPRTAQADPSAGGKHVRIGKGRHVAWDRIVDALPVPQLQSNGLPVLNDDFEVVP